MSVARAIAEKQHDDDLWENKDFIAELDRRTAEFETGKVKGLSFDELTTRTKQAYKNRKRKKL
ncbi:addiction module protein [Pseudoflavitalea sp. X16]|uniref:addiction module protein n=1 Tax=Paraflavitalea devenefica TaxID=2716334 RepID=UPI00142381B9|nr:addiction module protein [Paraflavitalea devenefica]NII26647.1 addiction module protein [Paraflavitalea devenefica]